MTFAVALMTVWFALVAYYLLRQFFTGALAVAPAADWEMETAALLAATVETEAPATLVAFPLRRNAPLAAS